MPRNLRSIVAQVTGIRGSVGSSRKFSSTSGSEGGGDKKNRFIAEMGFLVCAIGALENLLRITKASESAQGNCKGE